MAIYCKRPPGGLHTDPQIRNKIKLHCTALLCCNTYFVIGAPNRTNKQNKHGGKLRVKKTYHIVIARQQIHDT